ncbi:MAG: hypothetical protein K9N47_00925 [Prosthecobacter sp.]|uniref:hypothetical protein n=1 Tax=Prosthecobacter sp. TaxID=1965333 RepID=UPI0025E73430|nr:hypothetical protein [Prosthecobacter sp.]MCF7784649.1 hypothetical protein [Prosthecobacter sp.]
MLEIQKYRFYERSRLRAKGVTDVEIEKVQHLPFKPAFVDGKRRQRDSNDGNQVSPDQFAFRKER